MKRGFTLIELMVVISIIAVLTSILFIRVSLAQSKARDNTRIQQIHQIDLATRLYTEQNGHAPYLNGLCSAQSITQNPESACFTISTSGGQGSNWEIFKQEISPYIKSVPNDPCPNCDSGSGQDLGYTYIPPLLFEYQCEQLNNGVCPLSESELNSSYQVYTALEQQSNLSGNSTDGSITYYTPPSDNNPPPNPDTIAPTAPTGFSGVIDSNWANGVIGINFTWNASTDDGGSGLAGYKISPVDGINDAPVPGVTRRVTASLSQQNTQIFYVVNAYDNAGNFSNGLKGNNANISIPFALTTPTNLQITGSTGNYTLTWTASSHPADAVNFMYVINIDGTGQTYTSNNNSFSVPAGLSGSHLFLISATTDNYGSSGQSQRSFNL